MYRLDFYAACFGHGKPILQDAKKKMAMKFNEK
jgi:hypothetical protein